MSVHTRALNLAGPSPLVQSQSHPNPHLSQATTASSYSHTSSSISGATLVDSPMSATSSSDPLRPAPQQNAPTNGGLVMASDSIINQVADSSKSLYQICVKLRQRLREVPGFKQHLDEMREDDSADGSVDPVESMWRCLRKGYPLMTVYNALNPEIPLTVDEGRVAEAKRAKTASFKFVQACLKDLNFPPDECFLIMDLYGDDTTGFVKVTTVVNRVLDILQQRNLLLQPEISDSIASTETNQTLTRRDYIVGELVNTERKYVQDLETLQQFKKLVEEKGEVAGDTIHAIFLNLNALLDFQRRFLIRIETMNSLPENQQNWGQLFTQYHDAFRVYEPYIANQQNADEQAMREFDKLQKVGHRITNDRATLSGFIMKPFQRLSKYPLLLKELRDRCDAEEYLKNEITTGIESAAQVLQQANQAIEKQHRQLAVDELRARVEDWKSHDIQQFGDLLLHGAFTVVKGDGRNDVEREVRINSSHSSSTNPGGGLSVSRARARLGNLPAALDFSDTQSQSVVTVKVPGPHPQPLKRTSDPMTPGSVPRTPGSVPATPQCSDEDASAKASSISTTSSKRRSPPTPSTRSPTSVPTSPDPSMQDLMALPGWPDFAGTPAEVGARRRSSEIKAQSRKRSLKQLLSILSPIKSEAGWPMIETAPEDLPEEAPLRSLSRAEQVQSRQSVSTSRQSASMRSSQSSGEGSSTGTQTVSSPLRVTTLASDLKSEPTVAPSGGMLAHIQEAASSTDCDAGAFAPYHHGTRSTTFLEKRPPKQEETTILEERFADEHGLRPVRSDQYTIYLFERILLCCKEQNPNKQKNKVMSMNKPALDKKGKPRLQLKGRIFMQNVTETLSLQKPGSYTIQIFWKGDPGVENFVIRFTNEETMKKWYDQVEKQRELYADASRGNPKFGSGTSDTEFAWVKNQGVPMQNPYQEEGDGEEDEDAARANGYYNPGSDLSMSRTTSNTSLRTSRPPTGDGGAHVGGRVPPPRFPIGNFQPPSLTLHTQMSSMPSPGDPHQQGGPSYFSPTLDTPMSSRASGSSSTMYPFPRQSTPSNGWGNGAAERDDHNRFTAPAMGRNIMRPSLPAMTPPTTLTPQNRSRSASSPDIHNRLNQGHRAPQNGQQQSQHQPPMPEVPIPPFPAHIAHMKGPVSRSQNNSPTNQPNGGLPTRAATQSPGMQSRDRVQQHRYTQPLNHEHERGHPQQHQHPHHPQRQSHQQHPHHYQNENHDHHRSLLPSEHLPVSTVTTDSDRSAGSLPHLNPTTPTSSEPPTPTQLKVKVSFDSNYVTLVVGMNISYQSLVDRIDAKLSRFTASSIGRGTIRLRYRDEDGDYVAIRSDEDIHIAFSDWREQQRSQLALGGLGEIQLFCQGVDN